MERRVCRLSSEKEKKFEEWKESYDEKAKKLGLSDEAKLSKDQKKCIKKLGDNRFLISDSPIKENEKAPQEEFEPETTEDRAEEKSLKKEISDKISEERRKDESVEDSAEKIAEAIISKLGEKGDRLKSKRAEEKPPEEKFVEPDLEAEENKNDNPMSEPQNLVKLLSTYRVSLDSPVRKLIKSIKLKGKEHLEEELDKIK